MNHYYLLLGPAMGFALGIFFAWFLMYSRMRLQESNASRDRAELEKKLEVLSNVNIELKEVSIRLDESRANVERLQQQLAVESENCNQEMKKRSALEEQVKKIAHLEKHIAELREEEKQAAVLRQKLQDLETTSISIRRQFDNELNENSQLREELKSAANRYDNLSEKLRDFAVLRERSQKLEAENTNLLKENEQLRNMESQLKQLNEIKEMYSRSIEENQTFRNQDLARHLVAVKDGLQQSIKAFNSAMRLANNPLLTGLVEIEPVSKISGQADTRPDKVEEETLDEIEEETTEINQLEGVN